MWNSNRAYRPVLAAAVVLCGMFAVVAQTGPAATAPSTAPTLKQLQMDRLQCAEAMLAAAIQRSQQGNGAQADVVKARRLLLESGMDLAETPAQRLAIAQTQVAACEAYLLDLENLIRIGCAPNTDVAYPRYDLAEARVTLAKMQAAR